LGLTSVAVLVIGSIVGTGVFTMSAVIAGAGTMGIIVLGVVTRHPYGTTLPPRAWDHLVPIRAGQP